MSDQESIAIRFRIVQWRTQTGRAVRRCHQSEKCSGRGTRPYTREGTRRSMTSLRDASQGVRQLTGAGSGTTTLAAALLLAALGLSACGGDAKAGDGIFTAGHLEPDHLVPGNTTSSYAFDVLSGLFDNLVGLTKDGKAVNLAAVSVTSDDQKVWTIKVRPGQRFHNGEPVTAGSFADGWNNAAYGPHAYSANGYFSHFTGYAEMNPEGAAHKPKADELSGVKVVDDSTLKVTLTDPFNQFPLLLTYPAFAPMPKAALKDLAASDYHPLANRPYI